MSARTRRGIGGLLLTLVLAAPAWGQEGEAFVPKTKELDADAPVDPPETKTEEKPDGWKFKLEVGTNLSLGHSSQVVGQPDGTMFQIGLVLNGAADFKSGQHEWQNRLAIAHTQTKTPQIDDFIKTIDNAELKSTYFYSLKSVPWLGPFGRVRAQTQLLPGYMVYAEDQDIQRDGATSELGNPLTERLPAQQRIRVTEAFEPLVLRESAGAFARPYNDKEFKLISTLGFGAQHIISQGGFAVADNEDTPQIEIVSILDSTQAGAEAEVEASGELNEMVSWTTSANVLYPFITTADTDLEGIDLMNVEFAAKLSVKVAKWASLDYVLMAKRVPLVLDAWQVQNSFLVSSSFNLL